MAVEEVVGKFIEYASSDPTMYGLIGMVIIASLSLNVKSQYDIKGLKEKLKKYEEDFERFRLNVEPLLAKHNIQKDINSELRKFLTESQLTWSGKK